MSQDYLLPYLTSGQGARTTISPSLTRRFDLITRGIRTFSLDNVSSDKTIATVSKFSFLDVLRNPRTCQLEVIRGHRRLLEVTKGNYERKFMLPFGGFHRIKAKQSKQSCRLHSSLLKKENKLVVGSLHCFGCV